MKRIGKYALITALVLGLAVFMAACGSSGGDGGGGGAPGVTSITTSTQGAQSAAASVTAAQSIPSTVSGLSSLGSSFSLSGVAGSSPALKAIASPLNRFTARLKPAALKARALAPPTQTETISCADSSAVAAGTENSETYTSSGDITVSPFTITMTISAKNCRRGNSSTNGNMTVTLTGTITGMGTAAQEMNLTQITLGMGASDSAPLTETLFADSVSTTVVGRSETAATLGITTAPEKISANGRFEDWDITGNTHEKQVMSNLSIAVTSTTAAIASAGTYSVDTMILDGGMAFTEYKDASSANVVKKGDSGTFRNLTLVAKTPVGGSRAGTFDYMSINGGMTIATIPANTCGDGTFDIVTNTDLKIDNTTGDTVAGQMTINSNVVVTFGPGGSMTVAVNGGAAVPYTAAELAALCPL